MRIKLYIWSYNDNAYTYSKIKTSYTQNSSMLNVTSRLAIRTRYLPNYEFDWSDTMPQRSRDSLTIDDFLPSEEDAKIVKDRATQYVMGFLVES